VVVLIALVAWGAPSAAQAQDAEEELRLHSDPHSFTNVIDAMDGDDPFDINVSLTFNREWSTGEIQREINDPAVANGRNSANNIPVGQHEHLRNTLTAGLQIGVFHDLAIYGFLPIVLSDTRNLKQPDSDVDRDLSRRVRREQQPPGWGAPTDAGGGLAIFDAPFNSQARSGIPHVNVGIAWGIFNQFRDNSLPTWVVMLEGQFAVGDPMRPCQSDPVTGDDVLYTDYNGVAPGGPIPAENVTRCNGGDDQGISDGVHWLSVETRPGVGTVQARRRPGGLHQLRTAAPGHAHRRPRRHPLGGPGPAPAPHRRHSFARPVHLRGPLFLAAL